MTHGSPGRDTFEKRTNDLKKKKSVNGTGTGSLIGVSGRKTPTRKGRISTGEGKEKKSPNKPGAATRGENVRGERRVRTDSPTGIVLNA